MNSIAIVGAGFMGWQIALEPAVHGYRVIQLDLSRDALRDAAASQRAELQRRLDSGQLSAEQTTATLQRLSYEADLQKASAAGLVIEAIPEKLELKRDLFRKLDQICPEQTILATNSSSIRISAIEDAVKRRDRVLNMHFFGHIWERPMVELMGGSATSPETIAAAAAFVESIHLTPLIVRKESTGFIFNRIWRAIKKESLRVADDGVASIEDIDRAFMIFMNHDIGPFGLMDMIGLDVIRDIELVYFRESGDPADAPPRVLLDKIKGGELGVKTGAGFYRYPDPAFRRPDFLGKQTGRS